MSAKPCKAKATITIEGKSVQFTVTPLVTYKLVPSANPHYRAR